MERDEQPKVDVEERDDTTDEETEGHSLGVVMAMNELLGGSKPKRTYRRDPDEEIRPINKPFPRMRQDKPR